MTDYLTQLAAQYKIILGSGSPRRAKLLKESGIEFETVPPVLEEKRLSGESPYKFAERLSGEKALQVAATQESDCLVLGCDTIVVLDDDVLQKPTNETDAHRILTHLSGKQHVVCTAVAFAWQNKIAASGYELTSVFFNSVSSEQIDDYIATGEPMDKAGAYGIQGMGAFLVDRIDGNLDNVIGLPCTLLRTMAKGMLTTLQES